MWVPKDMLLLMEVTFSLSFLYKASLCHNFWTLIKTSIYSILD